MQTVRPILILSLVVATLAGCVRRARPPAPAEPPKPVTVYHRIAYAHTASEVKRAYMLAMQAAGLAAEDSPDELRAVTGPSYSPGKVIVTFGRSDTLTTRVSISYEYLTPEATFIHYPYVLPLRAYRHLDTSRAIVSIPERVDPPTLAFCPPAPTADSRRGLVEPAVVGGHQRLARFATYTEDARRAEVQGTVYLSAVVSETGGRVTCVEVISGLPLGLTESAIRALTSVEFTPATRDGRAIARKVILPVRFVLMD